jgi:hemoglobin-like flavoprotein
MNPVAQSLETLAARGLDPAPLVYARLFARYPETEALFWRDTSGQIKGNMLAHALNAILDASDGGAMGRMIVENECVTHAEMGVAPAIVPDFLDAVASAIETLLGPDWTADTQAAWARLIAGLKAAV